MHARSILVLNLALASSAGAQTPLETRGDYLTNRVAMCGDCHSPHGDHGQVIAGREFTGGPMPGPPRQSSPHYAADVPSIRGLPHGFNQSSLAALLETGLAPGGVRLRPPMPQFRLRPDDARAVAAYIASVKP